MRIYRLMQLMFVVVCLASLFILVSQLRELGATVSVTAGLIYYGVPITLGVVAFLGIFLPQSARTCIVISGVSGAVALLGADLYFSLTQKPARSARHEQSINKWNELGLPHDSRTNLQVVEDRRKAGEEIYPKLNPGTLLKRGLQSKSVSSLRSHGREFLPVGTISRMKSVYCNETGQFLIYRSDRYGFHNPENVWEFDHISVAAVGDSFTEGACLPSNSNFMSLIRRKYPATLNLGMGGNGPLIELAALTEYLTPKRPRIVLWVYFEGNDLRDMESNRNSSLLRSYLRAGFSQDLINRQPEIDRSLRSYFDENMEKLKQKRDNRRFSLIDTIFLRNVRNKLRYRLFSEKRTLGDEDKILSFLGLVINAAKTRVEGWGGRLMFVALPHRQRGHNDSPSPRLLRLRNRVLEIVETAGVPVINVAAEYEQRKDSVPPLMYRPIGHFTEWGHEFVSQIILRTVDRMIAHPGTSRNFPSPSKK